MHISDVGMTGNLLRWSSTYECSDKHFYIFFLPQFSKFLQFLCLKFPSIIAADNFIWCLVSVQIVDIFYPIMSFQIVLREAAQVGYMQSKDWYTISPSLCTSLCPCLYPLHWHCAHGLPPRPARQPKRYSHRHTGHETEDLIVVSIILTLLLSPSLLSHDPIEVRYQSLCWWVLS